MPASDRPDPAGVAPGPIGGLGAKRAFDLVVALASALVLAPLIALLALVVRAKLGKPVLFRQVRPGRNGVPFELVKFRTMRDLRNADGSPLRDDERLTPFGRWLRATSLDELPELWNILRGDMSLVGPRPLLMKYLPLYTPAQLRRHDVPPGLTGWAQVNGRNAINWEEKLALDVWYVDNRSMLLDIRILLLTFVSVLSRRGIAADESATMPEFTGSAGPPLPHGPEQ